MSMRLRMAGGCLLGILLPPCAGADEAAPRADDHDHADAHAGRNVRAVRAADPDGDAQLVDRSMDHVTFRGGSGADVLGGFATATAGLGDTQLAAPVQLRESGFQRLHATVGLTLPSGATDATGAVLAPTGMTPTLRLPYPMQPGSGQLDLQGGLTRTRFFDTWSGECSGLAGRDSVGSGRNRYWPTACAEPPRATSRLSGNSQVKLLPSSTRLST